MKNMLYFFWGIPMRITKKMHERVGTAKFEIRVRIQFLYIVYPYGKYNIDGDSNKTSIRPFRSFNK